MQRSNTVCMTLLYPSYFPNIASYIVMAQSDDIVFEICDSYQKQTYRNRCYIYGANGKLSLNIPVQLFSKKQTEHEEIEIDNILNGNLHTGNLLRVPIKPLHFLSFMRMNSKTYLAHQKSFF